MSNQSYKELAIPHFKEVFDILDEVLTRLEIPYYLVGVSAIALKLLEEGIKPSRGTKDIDFAIMVSSRKEFDTVMDAMLARGFNKVESPWTLYHPVFVTVIDLLPFGQIEQNKRAGFHQRKVDLHVLGFKEVLESSERLAIEDKLIQIPPLAGMVLLKLIAWSDRPEIRSTDLYDILTIIQHYFDLNYDEIVEHHYDIFPEDNFDQLKIASRVLGRHARIRAYQKADSASIGSKFK